MPAKSKAQQRLMQAAEHGAQFPLAQKLRASMSHAQLHDFASGSEKGKPQHVKRAAPTHPKMTQRARMVAEASAHLGSAIPGFHSLPKHQKMGAIQHHVNLRLGKAR